MSGSPAVSSSKSQDNGLSGLVGCFIQNSHSFEGVSITESIDEPIARRMTQGVTTWKRCWYTVQSRDATERRGTAIDVSSTSPGMDRQRELFGSGDPKLWPSSCGRYLGSYRTHAHLYYWGGKGQSDKMVALQTRMGR